MAKRLTTNKPIGDNSDLLATARRRFRIASDAESDMRNEARDDVKFRKGEQWPDNVKHQREIDRRPCLTINRLPGLIRQVINDQRQNRPSIKVSPVDDIATIETAKVIQGIVRHIEYRSNAEIAYDTACDSQITSGCGYFRIVTEYVDELSFHQEISIKRINDPFSVYMDPSYREPDGSDSNFAFIITDLSKDEFKSQFPNSKLSQMSDWSGLGNQSDEWVANDGCRVAEYFFKTFKKDKIYLLSDGSTVNSDDIKLIPDGIEIVKERGTVLPAIKWVKTNGIEVLEQTDWLGSYIPIIPVLGEEIWFDGKRWLSGVTRYAKDSQRMYNYQASNEAESIALAPKAPFIVDPKAIEGYERQWKELNTKNQPYLPYKTLSADNGFPLPPPQRQSTDANIQAITQARMLAAQDLNTTTGIYEPTVGKGAPQQSGVAIQRLNTQAQTSNFHFADNFSRSLKHAGRIIVELIPRVYSTPQVINIIKDDESEELVAINQTFTKDGKSYTHNLNAGKYDVTISVGPSYQTKRQEAVAAMLDLVRAYPQIMNIAGDLLLGEMDWNKAQELAQRLKLTLPPQIQQAENGHTPTPQQSQIMVMQLKAQNQALQTEVQELLSLIKTKRVETDSRERIAALNNETELRVEYMKHHANAAEKVLDTQIHQIDQQLEQTRKTDLLSLGIDPNALASAQKKAQLGPQGLPANVQQFTGGFSPG